MGGRPVTECVGLDKDKVWLSINYPKGTGPLQPDWREQLCREAARGREDHSRTMELIELKSVKKAVRRRSTDPVIIQTLQRLQLRVSEIDRSGRASGVSQQHHAVAALPADARAPAPETWRQYASEEGQTGRIARRAAQILRNPPNASKINNKMNFGSRDTGHT
jgi:hypothetical protein